MKTLAMYLLVFPLSCCFALTASGEQSGLLSSGQTLYVPAYSHIYSGDRETPFPLTVTLSIRNVDPDDSITITAVDYYESQGKLLRKHLSEPLPLAKLGSARYVIPQRDATGGSGANFIVAWTSDRPVNAPIVETIMIGAQLNQGISFTSRGRVIVPTR